MYSGNQKYNQDHNDPACGRKDHPVETHWTEEQDFRQAYTNMKIRRSDQYVCLLECNLGGLNHHKPIQGIGGTDSSLLLHPIKIRYFLLETQ